MLQTWLVKTAAYAAVVSGSVLNFVPEPHLAVRDMIRAARAGDLCLRLRLKHLIWMWAAVSHFANHNHSQIAFAAQDYRQLWCGQSILRPTSTTLMTIGRRSWAVKRLRPAMPCP